MSTPTVINDEYNIVFPGGELSYFTARIPSHEWVEIRL